MARTSPTGPPRLTLRAWPFGAASRRRLLEVLLIGRQPKAGWTRPTLEQACGVSVGTLDDHLAALVALGLLEHDEGTFTVRASRSQLVEALRVVLRQTARTPDRPAQPLPRRRYTQRSQGSS